MYIRYNFLGTTFWHVLLFVIISYTGEVTTKLAQIYTYCCILMYTTLLADVLCRVIVAIHREVAKSVIFFKVWLSIVHVYAGVGISLLGHHAKRVKLIAPHIFLCGTVTLVCFDAGILIVNS